MKDLLFASARDHLLFFPPIPIMHLSACLALLSAACAVTARSAAHVGKKLPKTTPKVAPRNNGNQNAIPQINRRAPSANASKYAVDGTKIPDVPFDIGESYAGLLPISSYSNETRKLYFWYFPSENPEAEDEVSFVKRNLL